MQSTITLFEHEATPYAWTDADLARLERLRRSVGVNPLRASVQGSTRVLQATEYIGVFRLGNHTVQVLPKMYRSHVSKTADDHVSEATVNLLHMLSYAMQLPIQADTIISLTHHESNWLEIMTRIFATRLRHEWQRGAYHSYRVAEAELPVLKGKWRIADQLRHPERGHQFAVAYSEFTADNALNRVLRYVVEHLWRLTQDATNRRYLGELRHWMDEVAVPAHLTLAEAPLSLISRLNQQYLPLLNLARLFLGNSVLQLASGNVAAFALLLDMNRLFEAFVASFIQRHRVEVLPPSLRDCELLVQSHGTTFFLARVESTPVFRLQPDLAFRTRESGAFPLLVDTKYKRLTHEEATSGVAQNDFYQMTAYAFRYHSPRVLLLYPQTGDVASPTCKRFHIEGSDSMIVAATIDLRSDLRKQDERTQLVQRLRLLLENGASNG